ncbi:MAG: hypothetical protein ACOCQX_04375 [Candidatus Nanoarchaeia archaeon]
MKKGFQLSLNVIVVAILALIVLVSSTIFFADKFGFTTGELSKCASMNGQCVDEDECEGRVVDATCPDSESEECCVDETTMVGGNINGDESE